MQARVRATNHRNTSQQQVSSSEQHNFIQNFVENWLDFVHHVVPTKFCRGDKILINRPPCPNLEAFTPGDLSLQPIAAMSEYDLSLDVEQRVAAICRLVCPCIITEKL